MQVVEDLLAIATTRWEEWFGTPTDKLLPAVFAGGPAHRDRAVLALLHPGEGAPTVVVKIGIGASEIRFVEKEYGALTRVSKAVAPAFSMTFPRPLLLHRSVDLAASFTTAVAGRRLATPALSGPSAVVTPAVLRLFTRRATTWSNELAAQTAEASRDSTDIATLVDSFATRFEPHTAHRQELDAFAGRISRERIAWTSSWQHGDLTMPNVLVDGGRLRVLDWEHAGPDRQPWLDAGTLPGMLAYLAKRQGAGATLVEAARTVLSTRGRIGAVMASELKRAWHHPIPLGWGVTLAAMHKALLQARNIEWPGWADLAVALLQDRSLRSELSWMAP